MGFYVIAHKLGVFILRSLRIRVSLSRNCETSTHSTMQYLDISSASNSTAAEILFSADFSTMKTEKLLPWRQRKRASQLKEIFMSKQTKPCCQYVHRLAQRCWPKSQFMLFFFDFFTNKPSQLVFLSWSLESSFCRFFSCHDVPKLILIIDNEANEIFYIQKS